MGNRKNLSLWLVGALLMLAIGSILLFLISKNKEGIQINSEQEIQRELKIVRNYGGKSEVVYETSVIRSVKEAVKATHLAGESSLTLTVGNQTQAIVPYIDANTSSFYLEITVITFDEGNGTSRFNINYHDQLNTIDKTITFSR